MKSIQLFILLSLLLLSCKEDVGERLKDLTKSKIEEPKSEELKTGETYVGVNSKVSEDYKFNEVSDVLILEKPLIEISGLSLGYGDTTLLANNDEKGNIYEVSIASGKIINKYKFAPKGDYEGIERVEDEIVVSKHNGNLYFYDLETDQTREIKTDLSSKNDIEGLCYDKEAGLLLMASKGQGLGQEKTKKEKAIYAYNLEDEYLSAEPYLIVEDSILLQHIKASFTDMSKSGLKKLKKRAKDFSPSGIAIHPITGHRYMISARGSTLVIYDRLHEFVELVFLNDGSIPQPEGICFTPNGDLFISTEGKGFSGKIFKFNYSK